MTSNTKDTERKRNLLGRQPARALLLDVNPPFNQHICDALCESLENLFAVSCNIAGPSRIPLISIFLLAEQPEILLPLSNLRGSFSRIQNALKTVQTAVFNNQRTHSKDHSCVSLGVKQAIEQFQRHVCTYTQPGPSMSQLEVIIVTCQRGDAVCKTIEAETDSLQLHHLKRIVCVTVTPWLHGYHEDELLDLNSQSSSTSENSNTLLSGLVDTVVLDADQLSLQNFFRGWLVDCSSDSEHLHIMLPAQDFGRDKMIIKCDLQETVLNPAQLPCNSSYTLHPESATCKVVFASMCKAAGISIPVHRITITSLTHSSSVCESVLFGMPLVVHATSCWKVDWDELETNQQNFKALCHLLNKQDLVMLGQMDQPTSSKNTIPQGWFVFLPAPNNTLLVKSVAVSELILPANASSSDEDVPEESLSRMESTLSQIEVLTSFNPLSLRSGLFESLRSQAKTSRTVLQARKREVTQDSDWPAVSSCKVVSGWTTNQRQQAQERYPNKTPKIKRPLAAFVTELQ